MPVIAALLALPTVVGLLLLVARSRREIQRAEARDPLTGLLSHHGFRVACRRHLHGDSQRALLTIDLDHFQFVNESAGYLAGDHVLRTIGTVLGSRLKKDDQLGRTGANTFTIYLARRTADDVDELASTLRRDIRNQLFTTEDGSYGLTATIGVALLPPRGADLDATLAASEAALFFARSRSRDSQETVTVGVDEFGLQQAMRTVMRLPELIANDGLRLVVQQIPSLRSASKRCELLLRGVDPATNEPIGAGELVGPAETFGFIAMIDKWVVGEALAIMAAGRLDEYEFVGINISAASIDASFTEHVVSVLHQYPEQANRVSFELTETALTQDLTVAHRFMDEVRSLGPTFAIDDFGVGTASFGMLRSLPFDTMKIDGRFVAGIGVDPTDSEVIRGFVTVARSLGISTVAECAETAAQVARLRELDIDYVQGYAMHRPEPIPELKSAADSGV